MKLMNLSLNKTYLAAINKRFFAEVSRQDIPINKLKRLTPEAYTKSKIITRSLKGKTKLTDPTKYEDCFEKMSFEHPKEKNDFWRKRELYVNSADNTYLAGEKYSYDDIPIPQDTVYNNVGFKKQIQPIYYPKADFSFNDQCKLKFIHFNEGIVPSSFDRKIRLNPNTVRNLAMECTHAWENGMPTPDIIKLLGKSVVKVENKPFGYPDEDLFKFLIKYPTKRSQVVVRAKNGTEYFDKNAAIYFEAFSKRLFSSPETVLKVLEECKSYETFKEPTVNKKLCNMVYILRRKTAHALPKETTLSYPSMHQTYCPPSTPWGEKESKLLNYLKPDGFVDEEYYNIMKDMFLQQNKTIDEVLEYMDIFIPEKNTFKRIMSKYERQYAIFYLREQKNLQALLESEMSIPGVKSSTKKITHFIEEMQEKKLPIRDTSNFAQILQNSEDPRFNIDTEKLLKFINTCLDDKNIEPKYRYSIVNSLYKMYLKGTEKNFEEELKFANNIYQHTANGEPEYCIALQKLIEMHTDQNQPFLKIAKTNLDEFAKYIKSRSQIIDQIRSKKVQDYLRNSTAKYDYNFLTLEKLKAEDSPVLKVLSNIKLKNMKLPDVIKNIRKECKKQNTKFFGSK